MKLYYIATARMPTDKAHGIQIAKMCEAFIEAGVDLTLIVPQRATDSRSLREYYGLRVDVPLVRLPILDWYGGGSLGYVISSLSFMYSYVRFLMHKKNSGERYVLYTVGLDSFSSSGLLLLHLPVFAEMHDAKYATCIGRMSFKRMRGIITVNQIIADELRTTFPHSPVCYLVEPNGVDISSFHPTEKREARERLGLPQDTPLALYVGRFFEWKGLEILPKAAAMIPTVRFQIVGGNKEEFEKLVKEPLPANFFFAGSRPFNEIPLWCATADVLLVLGTKRDIQSYRYTSPMKLFEYFAAKRPIIASGTPALREIVSEREVLFYEPDNVQDLARAVETTITQRDSSRVDAAMRQAVARSWRARVARILHFIQENVGEYEYV